MTKSLQFCLHHHLHHSKSNLVPAWHEDSQRCFLESLPRLQDLGDLLHHLRLHLTVVPSQLSVPKFYKIWNIFFFQSIVFNCVDLFNIWNMIEILNICSKDGGSQSLGWKTRNESNYDMREIFRPERQGLKIHSNRQLYSICMHLWKTKFFRHWLKAIQCYSSSEKTKLNGPQISRTALTFWKGLQVVFHGCSLTTL